MGFKGRTGIFELIRDDRSTKAKVCSLAASLCLNAAVMTAMVIAFEFSAVRRSSERLLSAMQREFRQYRMVLLVPHTHEVAPATRPKPVSPRALRVPKPLAVPNPRLLRRLDPRIASFVKENPEIESIITREIVRDVDRKVLDVSQLLKKSSIRLSFEMGEAGHISQHKIDKSSRVPSIDHLALELVKLLEKYQMLGVATGVRKVVVSISIDQQIEISLEGEVADPADLESVRRQVQNGLTLMRFALANSDAAFMLKDILLTTNDNQVIISKSFEKEPLVSFLMRYCQAEPQR